MLRRTRFLGRPNARCYGCLRMGKVKLVKAKKRCCKSKPRCKRCAVVCKRLAREGLAVRQDKRHYVVELPIPKKALKAARAR
jgi:hypothetical protein